MCPQRSLCQCGDSMRFRGLFEVGNERILECRDAARLDQTSRGIDCQNPS